jgi:arsenate reductase (thioredoxin)
LKTKVLFVCSANTTRSQIAEALLKKYGGEDFEANSAGINPGVLNPLAVEVLKEDENMDISLYTTNKILDYYKEGKHYHYVITVCDEASKEPCPVFPSLDGVLHWNIISPASDGTNEEKKAKIKVSKEEIKTNILKFIELVKEQHIKSGFPESWHINQ